VSTYFRWRALINTSQSCRPTHAEPALPPLSTVQGKNLTLDKTRVPPSKEQDPSTRSGQVLCLRCAPPEKDNPSFPLWRDAGLKPLHSGMHPRRTALKGCRESPCWLLGQGLVPGNPREARPMGDGGFKRDASDSFYGRFLCVKVASQGHLLVRPNEVIAGQFFTHEVA